MASGYKMIKRKINTDTDGSCLRANHNRAGMERLIPVSNTGEEVEFCVKGKKRLVASRDRHGLKNIFVKFGGKVRVMRKDEVHRLLFYVNSKNSFNKIRNHSGMRTDIPVDKPSQKQEQSTIPIKEDLVLCARESSVSHVYNGDEMDAGEGPQRRERTQQVCFEANKMDPNQFQVDSSDYDCAQTSSQEDDKLEPESNACHAFLRGKDCEHGSSSLANLQKILDIKDVKKQTQVLFLYHAARYLKNKKQSKRH